MWSVHWGTEAAFHCNLVFDYGASKVKPRGENRMEWLSTSSVKQIISHGERV